ncbi:MAG: conjugative transposon protein TraM [Prolixibacteraceae bacterium]|nr:conjugative transposon protein TraM [Prolixibacteraceae bacterium]
MTENKPENKAERERTELTPQQRQKRKKMLIYPLFFLLFAGSMWLIFAPSTDKKEKEQQTQGLNTDLPMPEEKGLVGNKREAYEQEAIRQKDKDKKRSLSDFAFLLEEEQSKKEQGQSLGTKSSLSDHYRNTSDSRTSVQSQQSDKAASIRSSVGAYQNINRQLGSWNDQPKTETDQQVQSKLENRIQELECKLEEDALRKKTEDDQLAVIEKSYQLAAKYMPRTTNQGANSSPVDAGKAISNISSDEKAIVQPVRQAKVNVVSLLGCSGNGSEGTESDSNVHNAGFKTVTGNDESTGKNSICACINQTVTLTNGKELQLRLMEPIQIGNLLIPVNTLITGPCRIGGERLNVTVTSIQYAGNIIPVQLQVYGTDGQAGISVPGNDAVTAAKEVASSLASSSGSSIMISDNAGSQLAADLGKGLIQGASQFVSKKMSTVRVTIKAGYQVLLLPKSND